LAFLIYIFKKISNKLSKYPKITEFLKYEFNYCQTYVPAMVPLIWWSYIGVVVWALYIKVKLKTSQYISNEV
jgi:hypothetical protein